MKSLRTTARYAALAAFVGLGAVAVSTPASAYIYKTDCMGDSCVRVRCDNDGDFCVRVGYREYDRPNYRRYESRYECDADGDNCAYVTTTYRTTSGYYDDYGYWHSYEY